jgi:hypothetical protein
VQIFAGALVPVVAHAVENTRVIGVGHAYPVFYP